ncbi:MAG: ATP-dependent endonuclease [Elusimicrobia bacterium]|nr:ATP-dependent endonuclease [Elusimicrobiota bacterium]
MTNTAVAPKPFGAAHPIDLGDTNARDQFQIICYENNNIAFFADTVVLVEGDSDYIVLPHLARVINPAWDSGQLPVRFARIGGKANIRRYRQFFKRFQAKVLVVTDLDFLLGSEFGQIEPADALRLKRDQLLATLDSHYKRNGGTKEPTKEQVKAAHEKTDLRSLWKKARELLVKQKRGEASVDDVASAVDDFFVGEVLGTKRRTPRLFRSPAFPKTNFSPGSPR